MEASSLHSSVSDAELRWCSWKLLDWLSDRSQMSWNEYLCSEGGYDRIWPLKTRPRHPLITSPEWWLISCNLKRLPVRHLFSHSPKQRTFTNQTKSLLPLSQSIILAELDDGEGDRRFREKRRRPWLIKSGGRRDGAFWTFRCGTVTQSVVVPLPGRLCSCQTAEQNLNLY